MGASDPMRQGFVLSRPDMAHKVISVIGDSTECHSGMDGTRNAIFRNIPGVKVILDNYSTAMTGQQPAPSSKTNLAGQDITFDLHKAIEAEGGRTVVVDAYDVKKVDKALDILTFSPKKGAEIVKKVVESAIANAENNNGADIDELAIKTIYVDKGTVLKRQRAGAKGRGKRIIKPTSHITVTVGN